MTDFSQLGLHKNILSALPELGIETPTEIQAKVIPEILKDPRDVIGLAQTGTGKTAAFGLPILQLIDPSVKTTQAIIVSPTRELAQQIEQQLRAFSKHIKGVRTLCVYGGSNIQAQISALKKPCHIVVGTPGRVIDLLQRKSLKINAVKFVVLDEADEMLNMGFKEDVDRILAFTPDDKLTWLFSATMPPEIKKIIHTYMDDKPIEVSAGSQKVNLDIEHQYAKVNRSDKFKTLCNVLMHDERARGIVFCRTKINTQKLADQLVDANIKAEAIHGDLTQAKRDRVMSRFKKESTRFLVATDVAARGIDVQNLNYVIHYNLPDNDEAYTHRSGRTGRAGKKGVSLSLVMKADMRKLKGIEKALKIKIHEVSPPDEGEMSVQKMKRWFSKVEETRDREIPEELMEEILSRFDSWTKEELLVKLIAMQLPQSVGRSKPQKDRDKRTRAEGKMIRFFMNIGKEDYITKPELIEFISQEAGINRKDIGTITLNRQHLFFEVKAEHENKVATGFRGLTIDGRDLRVNRDDGTTKGDYPKAKKNKKKVKRKKR